MTTLSTCSALFVTVCLSAVACGDLQNDGFDSSSTDQALTAAGGATSVYTDINASSCKVIEEGEAFTNSNCGGVGPYSFILQDGDLRFNAVIKSGAGEADLQLWAGSLESWPQPKPAGGFQDIGSKLEWRVPVSAKTSPYALVFRLKENEGRDQFLIVAKVAPTGSCLYKIIDGRAPNANVLAQQAADAARTGTCPAR